MGRFNFDCSYFEQNVYVFVYGTLLSDCQNHHIISNSKYIGKAKLNKQATLAYDKYPFVYFNNNEDHPNNQVYGEIYKVSRAKLTHLD